MKKTKKHFLSHLDKFWFWTGLYFTIFCLIIYSSIDWPWLKTIIFYYLFLGFVFSVVELITRNLGRGWRDKNNKLIINPHSGICSFALAQITVIATFFLITKIIGTL